MEFLSDQWLAALDRAARARVAPDDDPLAGVQLTVEQVVEDGPRWRLHIDDGHLRVEPGPEDGAADLRLTSDRATAAAIASGRRSALQAFIAGDLVLGGDVRVMLEHREALETLSDLFAELRAATTFPVPP